MSVPLTWPIIRFITLLLWDFMDNIFNRRNDVEIVIKFHVDHFFLRCSKSIQLVGIIFQLSRDNARTMQSRTTFFYSAQISWTSCTTLPFSFLSAEINTHFWNTQFLFLLFSEGAHGSVMVRIGSIYHETLPNSNHSSGTKIKPEQNQSLPVWNQNHPQRTLLRVPSESFEIVRNHSLLSSHFSKGSVDAVSLTIVVCKDSSTSSALSFGSIYAFIFAKQCCEKFLVSSDFNSHLRTTRYFFSSNLSSYHVIACSRCM